MNQQEICTKEGVHANPTDSRPVLNVKHGQMVPSRDRGNRLPVAESNEGGLGGYPGKVLHCSTPAHFGEIDPHRSKDTALGVLSTPGGVLGTCFAL